MTDFTETPGRTTVVLTPELATAWLYQNGKRFFLVDEAKVAAYAAIMAAGQWRDGSEIRFDAV
jgi:hypothetical protein